MIAQIASTVSTPTVKLQGSSATGAPEKPIPPENRVLTEGAGPGSDFEPTCWEDLGAFTRAYWCVRNWYKWRKCVDMGRAACHLIWSSNPQHAEIGEELWKLQDDMFEELFESWKNRKSK